MMPEECQIQHYYCGNQQRCKKNTLNSFTHNLFIALLYEKNTSFALPRRLLLKLFDVFLAMVSSEH